VDHVAQRLLSESFRGEAECRVRLLARCLGEKERLARPLPCERALRLLRNASLSAPPAVRFAALPLEVMAHIEDFEPMLPEEAHRIEIVEICARSARWQPENAQAVLHAACLRPWRVGLRAARAFAAVAAGGFVGEAVTPADFAMVGSCLMEGAASPLDGMSAMRVAGEVLGAAQGVVERWPPGARRWGLRDLCLLRGGLHIACVELTPASA